MPDYDDVPMMFRAQINERCKLENINNKEQQLKKWIKEWVDPQENGNTYQYIRQKEKNGLNGSIYRLFIKFNYRVLTNCGQDSIIRPIFGKNGIPFIPGSSIKGLFLRVCDDVNKSYDSINKQVKITQKDYYCGSQEHSAQVRFHGAYPVGNWTGKHNVKNNHKHETRYTILDLVHPQQKCQVQEQDSTSAYPVISLEKPTLMFQFSSVDSNINWDELKELFNEALSQGLGGKTSSGYGFVAKKLPAFTQNKDTFVINLQGEGVSSQTLSGDVEFRPNVFKASLRGHVTRLLAGISPNESLVNERVEELFGYTDATGLIKLFWQESGLGYRKPQEPVDKNIYKISGKLHISAPQPQRDFIRKVSQFAYIMAGFGKTWRRVSHNQFYKSYHKFPIGCHWNCSNDDFINLQNPEDLTDFLNNLFAHCQEYLDVSVSSQPTLQRGNSSNFINSWRESWHPDNVKVYSQVVSASLIVELFHEERFKYTPAIGGKNKGDTRPKYVSCVWHRMLPIKDNKYLEIVTIFKGNNDLWNGNKATFEQEIKDRGFTQVEL